MKEHEIEQHLNYIKPGFMIKLLPNYNKEREKQKDILEIFYLFYQHEDDRLFFFDDKDEPMPESLKLELFNTRYLSKMSLCYALIKNEEDDVPIFTMLNLSYGFLSHYASTINDYYDISEYPWFKIEKSFDDEEIVMLEEETMFKNEDHMIDFILEKSVVSIESLIKKYTWNSYGDKLTEFFKSNPSLNDFSNLFRIKKIKKFFKDND